MYCVMYCIVYCMMYWGGPYKSYIHIVFSNLHQDAYYNSRYRMWSCVHFEHFRPLPVPAGNVWNNLLTWFHELGHNAQLMHATTAAKPTCQYCDGTSAMGGEGGQSRCHNAAHNWALGWSTDVPGGHIVAENINQGTPLTLSVPSQITAAANTVRLETTTSTTVLFISFRTLVTPYDQGVTQPSLLIHSWPAKASWIGAGMTLLQAQLLSLGSSWTDPGTVSFTLTALTAGSATVVLSKGGLVQGGTALGSPLTGVGRTPLPPPSPSPAPAAASAATVTDATQQAIVNYWTLWWQQYLAGLLPAPAPPPPPADPAAATATAMTPVYDAATNSWIMAGRKLLMHK